MSARWRISIIVLCLLLTLVAACMWTMSQNARQPTAEAAVSAAVEAQECDPIQSFRTEREQLHAMQKSQLNDIIHSDDTDADTRRMAQRKLLTLMEAEEGETTLEGLLSVRGFEGALVTVSESAVTVIVRREALNQRETAIILEMVMRETGISGGNVKIIPMQ